MDTEFDSVVKPSCAYPEMSGSEPFYLTELTLL